MKVVFLKVIDPIAWRKPESHFYNEDLEEISILMIDRVAGVLLHETEESIVIGETTVATDNPKLAKRNWTFPRHRYIMTIFKKNVVERQDFEVKEN